MKLIFALLVMAPMMSLAAPKAYTIKADLFVDNELVSSPQVIVLPGAAAEIESATGKDRAKIKVVVTEVQNSPDAVQMEFEIEYIKGSKTIKSSPRIISKLGGPASVTSETTDSKIELKVVATR